MASRSKCSGQLSLRHSGCEAMKSQSSVHASGYCGYTNCFLCNHVRMVMLKYQKSE